MMGESIEQQQARKFQKTLKIFKNMDYIGIQRNVREMSKRNAESTREFVDYILGNNIDENGNIKPCASEFVTHAVLNCFNSKIEFVEEVSQIVEA